MTWLGSVRAAGLCETSWITIHGLYFVGVLVYDYDVLDGSIFSDLGIMLEIPAANVHVI